MIYFKIKINCKPLKQSPEKNIEPKNRESEKKKKVFINVLNESIVKMDF